jgi:hypothetical protein
MTINKFLDTEISSYTQVDIPQGKKLEVLIYKSGFESIITLTVKDLNVIASYFSIPIELVFEKLAELSKDDFDIKEYCSSRINHSNSILKQIHE